MMKSLVSCLKPLILGAMLATIAAPAPSLAETADAPVARSVLQARAEVLLDIAARHVAEKGEAGAQDFARQSAFVDRDLYAYALRTDGVFLASGGSSAALVGDNVLDYTDTDGKAFFREMIEIARRDGQGSVEYRWFNPADSRGEPKTTLFRKVGEVIVAVGYYPPRATALEARAMLRTALRALDGGKDAALAEFQDLNGRFVRNDLYVFVVDAESGRFLAHGATPVLVGTDGFELRDPRGQYIIRQMLEIARKDGSGELDYFWRNPTTGKMESKHTLFRLSQGLLVAVGSYNR
ncbi:cache domain-containing protein [Thauera sp. Sel9]|uniref:cache domain-containing protein n=1 Tax=Thauera sp. Sel9 TaxID=2974299 RepID=UPI002E15C920